MVYSSSLARVQDDPTRHDESQAFGNRQVQQHLSQDVEVFRGARRYAVRGNSNPQFYSYPRSKYTLNPQSSPSCLCLNP